MKILIADDHGLVRDTICDYLQRESAMEVSAAADLPSAMDTLRAGGPFDLVLLDLDMPGMNGLDGLETALRLNNEHPVAILSGVATREMVEQALSAGAMGYLPKTMAAKSLIHAVRLLASGERYAPLEFLTGPASGPKAAEGFALTRREREVVVRLVRGKSNKEIASDLVLSEATVKLHLKTLCRKLGARNRTHAAMIARDAGLS